MERVFCSFPYTGREEESRKLGKELGFTLAQKGFNPIIPQLYYPLFLPNSPDSAYLRALEFCKDLLSTCTSAIFIVDSLSTRMSRGMKVEMEEVKRLGIDFWIIWRASLWEELGLWMKYRREKRC
jgi:hypothetical protein